MSIQATKDKARTLVDTLRGMGIRLTHHRALEVLAKIDGAKGWNELAASAATSKPAAGLALTDAQQALLDQVVSHHVENYGIPEAGSTVKVVAAGDKLGAITYVYGVDPAVYPTAMLEIQLVAMHDIDYRTQSQPVPEVVNFVAVTLANEAEQCIIQDYTILDEQEVSNRTVDVALRQNNAYTWHNCPVTGHKHKTGWAVIPHVEGVPAWEFAIPSRVWDQAHQMTEAESRETRIVRVTVGEMRAALIEASGPDGAM